MKSLDFAAINKQAKKYEKPMVKFLREIVAIPSQTGIEGKVIARIRKELTKTRAYDKIWTDKFGNLLAKIGNGPRLIAIDAHVDTVGVGDPDEWKHDPYKGKVEKGVVWGRGAGDQKGATPAMVYAGRILRDLKMVSEDWTLLLTFTVAEEDCDGLCWQYIVKESKIRPECVVVTDSTDCKILRGQRGRMEIGVTVRGKSCHGSMPHKGDNAVYKIARVVREIESLNDRLRPHEFLGKATITVSYIDCKTPSLCAVPDQAYIHLDRRLTVGDTKESALSEVRAVMKKAKVEGDVKIVKYEKPTYTGLLYPTENFFPTWCEEEDAPQVAAAVTAYEKLFGVRQKPGRWTFSTNGVSIAGLYGIPCVGFGPAPEAVAHTVNDSVPIEHMVKCAAFYAAFPNVYCANPKR
jgi:putative selenium metabolism hydrolase